MAGVCCRREITIGPWTILPWHRDTISAAHNFWKRDGGAPFPDVGWAVGSAVGLAVGSAVGWGVGLAIGLGVGLAVGFAFGSVLEFAVGFTSHCNYYPQA